MAVSGSTFLKACRRVLRGSSARLARLSFLTAAWVVLDAVPVASAAQTIVQDARGGVCTDCLKLADRVTIGGDSERDMVLVGRGLIPLAAGELLHARSVGGMPIFSRSGRFLRAVGREGSGPVEFRNIQLILQDPRGGVHVFDAGNARHTVLDASLRLVKEWPGVVGRITSGIFLPDGRLVVNGYIPTRERVGLPLHVLPTGGGDIIRSFGLAPGELFDAEEAWASWRELALGQRGTVWAARRNKYQIEEWSVDGQRLSVIERRPEWFRPYQRRTALTLATPPQPHLERIHVDVTNRLWVFLLVPDPRWTSSVEEQPPLPGIKPSLVPTHYSGLYDTIVEVIDLKTMTLVASQRFPHYLWGFLDGERVYGDGGTQDGLSRYSVWRLDASALR